MFTTQVLAFAGATLLLAMVPGPSLALVLRQTLRGGRRQAFLTTLGNATGIVFWAVAAVLGLSVLVATSRVAYAAIRLVGAALLVTLGVRSLLASRRRDGVSTTADPACGAAAGAACGPRPAPGGLAGYRTGVLVSLANPKPAVFATSVLPQFAASPGLAGFLVLVGVWVAVSTAWYVGVSWTVGRVRRVLARAAVRRRLEQVSGAVLVGFGLRMVVETR